MNDDFLDQLQADVYGVLSNTPSLGLARIILDDKGGLEGRLETELATVSDPSGKAGMAVIVLAVEVDDAEINLPGPPLAMLVQVQVIELAEMNRHATDGTLIRSATAAVRVLAALHHTSLGTCLLYALPKKAIRPLPMRDGFVAHLVTLRAGFAAAVVTGKPLPVQVTLTVPPVIPEGQIRFTAPLPGIDVLLVPAGEYNGTDSWSKDGTQTPSAGPWWTIRRVSTSPLGQWVFKWAPDGLSPLLDVVTVMSDSAAVLPVEDSTWPSGADVAAVASDGVKQVIAMTFSGTSTAGEYIQLAYEFQLLAGGPVRGDMGSPSGIYEAEGGLDATNQASLVAGALMFGEGNLTDVFDITVVGPTLYLTRKTSGPDMHAFQMTADPDWGPVVTATTLTHGSEPVIPDPTLTLTCESPGSSIRYTTDGSYPAPAATLYTAPFAPPAAGTVIRAAAYVTGQPPGDVLEFTVTE